jgi:hypothetical protein
MFRSSTLSLGSWTASGGLSPGGLSPAAQRAFHATLLQPLHSNLLHKRLSGAILLRPWECSTKTLACCLFYRKYVWCGKNKCCALASPSPGAPVIAPAGVACRKEVSTVPQGPWVPTHQSGQPIKIDNTCCDAQTHAEMCPAVLVQMGGGKRHPCASYLPCISHAPLPTLQCPHPSTTRPPVRP